MLKIQKKILTILIILLYFTSTNSYAFILTILKPLGFIAAAIADRVTSVQVIQANGITAHNYSLCPLDIIKIKNADFLISIGNNTELLFLNKIIQSFKKNIELSSIKNIQLLLIYKNKKFQEKKEKKILYKIKKKLIMC